MYDAFIHDALIHDACIHDACIHDACIHDACIHDVMHVSMMNVSMIHVSMMHASMMYVSMMHVFMMQVPMILDPDTCMYDAYIYPDTLKLSDLLTGTAPVFNSRSVSLYYKLKLSVSTVSDSEIKQLVSIPMISVLDKFSLSHSKCHNAHVCLESSSGIATLPITDFIRCHGVTSYEIPTFCPFRACLTSQSAVCRMLNLTTAIVSSSEEFETTLHCNNHYDKKNHSG